MKNFFSFNFSHRNGIILLSVIIVSVFFINSYNQSFNKEQVDFSKYKKQLEQLKKLKENKFTVLKKNVNLRKEHRVDLAIERISIEINTVDSSGLKKLPAIGSVFANRICKFRQILGGFVSLSQLLEVYGMDSVRFSTIKPYLLIDLNQVKTLNINSLNTGDLKKHPYISHKEANAIVNYRRQHGVYETLSDLLRIHLIDSIKLRKIAPYLSTNDSSSISQKYKGS